MHRIPHPHIMANSVAAASPKTIRSLLRGCSRRRFRFLENGGTINSEKFALGLNANSCNVCFGAGIEVRAETGDLTGQMKIGQ